ncbi:hypothetical protein CCACVL1_29095, partial [Corchorus capsularis]
SARYSHHQARALYTLGPLSDKKSYMKLLQETPWETATTPTKGERARTILYSLPSQP